LIAALTAISLFSFCLDKYFRQVGILSAAPIIISTLFSIVSLYLLIKDSEANPDRTGIAAYKNDLIFAPQLLILLLLV
jgi:hypothetical protein